MTIEEIVQTFGQAIETGKLVIDGVKSLAALPHADKVKVIRDALDQEIGNEVTAEIKSVKIPGTGMSLSGDMLEKVSDMILDAIATMIVNKFFPED